MKELLFSITKKDFDIQFFSGTGAGGQHRNKHQNCVRLTHRDSGVTKTGQSNRNREANIKEAFRGIVNDVEFKLWHKREIAVRLQQGISLEDKINAMLRPENLKIEVI
jgi:peptide chain release factor 1